MSDELPSYTTLFGPMDHSEGNESRSVLSPAAYLVDLLELRDSAVSLWTDYHERRLDVRDIPLNQENTYTEIPFLDVANAVMKKLVPGDKLQKSLFPAPLPFAEQQLRLKLYAEKLGTSLEEIQRLYRTGAAADAVADARTTARLRLGLSQEEYDLFRATHESDIPAVWGAAPGDLDGTNGPNVEPIKKRLGLSLKELKQLLRQNLADSEIDRPPSAPPPPPDPRSSFFINPDGKYVVLDEGTHKLQLKGGPALTNLTNKHLDRMMRFVRLARRLDLEFQDLDWFLQSACGNALDEDALQAIAIALDIRKRSGWAMDEICSLWSAPKAHGLGEDRIPADLFDRAFNNDFPSTLQELVDSGATADALNDRLRATLRLSSADFAFLKDALQGQHLVGEVARFSGFRRIAKLAELLSLSVQEVMMLLDVLGAQWSVSEHDDLAVPMPFSTKALPGSPLELLLDPQGQPPQRPRRTLDVLQKLLRVKEWLDLRQISPRQLAYICLEDHFDLRELLEKDGSPIDGVQPNDAVESALDELHQSLHDALLAPAALQTGSLTAGGAQAAFDSLREAKVLVTFDDPARAFLRVEPTAEELAEAMRRGIHERLEVHDGELGALGITDLAPLFELLVSRGYLEGVAETVNGKVKVHHFIAPGLESSFSSPTGATDFTAPNFQEHAEAVFSVLAQLVDANVVPAAALAKTGVGTDDVPALFQVLQTHGWVELVPVPGSSSAAYHVPASQKKFFQDLTNASKFVLPDFTAVFPVLAAKVEAFVRAEGNLKVEAQDLGERLSALSEQQSRTAMRTLAGLVGLSEDLTELAFAWVFGTPGKPPGETPAQTLATLALPLFRAKDRPEPVPALADAFLASRFRRLQQLGLLLRKTKMSADEARVYLENQQFHRRLPETLKVPLKVPDGFLAPPGKIDALTTLPNGNFLIVSGQSYAVFSGQDYRLLGQGTLNQLPSDALRVTLSDDLPAPPPHSFRGRVLADGIDAAFSDTGADGKTPVLQLFAGDQYVTFSQTGTSDPKSILDWGRVRNNIQQNGCVDAAVQDKDGRLFVFSGDQYFRYTDPTKLLVDPPFVTGSPPVTVPPFVDERYPKSIRGKFEHEGVSPLPALMFSKVDAAFRDTEDRYYFFSGSHFSRSDRPYTPVRIRPAWGHVLNWLFEDVRVDAAFVLGGVTYLTRKDQLTRYSDGGPYRFVDERYPISFSSVPDTEPLLRVLRRFPDGLDAALAGSDGRLYAFKNGAFAGSAAPDTSLAIRDHWGLVRNVFVDNQRVDAALAYGGAVYLFCGDQYVRYSVGSSEYVDEGYPRRVGPNWNALEGIGRIPDGLPLPITAVAVGRAPGGAADDVYFFGGNQYAGPSGALGDVKAQWARVRNNVERTGVVDAAMLDGGGRMYLFSGDQVYRYSTPDQDFVDETFPRRIAGAWPQEGNGYSLPDSFAGGLSAALQTGEGKVYFFSGQSYARADAPQAAPPRPNAQDWGVVRNWIQSQNQVSAAFVDPSGKAYLFGGDQFVRYSGTPSEFADEGYPLAIGNRWGSNLPDFFRSDIDAALSFKSPVDNVQRLYLFKSDQYVRYSTADYSQVDAGYPKPVGTAHQVEGLWFRGLSVHEPNPNSSHLDDPIVSVEATYVDTAGGQPRINVFYRHEGGVQWRRQYQGGSWGAPVRVETITEYAPFTRLDAAFVSADGTLHAFSGTRYASRPPAGGPLTAPVPIKDRWARVWNQFADLGRVDAALNMGDGRTYLFCNKQFIKYTGTLRPGAADFYVEEGYPRRIDTSWARESVPVTLAPEFQAAGYDLCRDATGKVHFFNGTRYNFSGNTGADAVLTSRWGKVENRFKDLGRVDGAYRAENDKLYLFCDTQYTRYSGALQPGAADFYSDEGYPRHVTTGWASEGLAGAMPATWNALGSAVFRDAQQTYVFSGQSFTSSQAPAPAPVIPRWAKVRNQMQSQNRVDAGFVLGDASFLFCDDQYVRYGGAYGGFVDEGYPKAIAHLAAPDGVFPGLPAQLQSGLRAFFAGTDGHLHAFGPQPPPPAGGAAPQPQRWVSSASPDALRPLNETWGIVDNKLWDDEFVNAALLTPKGELFLFSGDQYVRYSGALRPGDADFSVDEGYPRQISTSYAEDSGVTTLAPVLNQGVDAALTIGTRTFYFVNRRPSPNAQPGWYVDTALPDVASPLVDRWGLVQNLLQESKKLDAAFVAPNGKLHLFAQSQVCVYSGTGRGYVDEEYPRTIATDIGLHWPHHHKPSSPPLFDFRSNLDAAASFEGRSYLFQGGRHVRISDFRLGRVDAGYPRHNAAKLVDRFDFELGTLPDWWRIKALFDDYASQSTTALGYFDEHPPDPVSGLALATQWPAAEIKELLKVPGFPNAGALRDGRAVARLARCFELADRMGTAPSRLKSQVWDLVFGTDLARDEAAAADFLYGLIKSATGTKDWPGVARSLLDPVESAGRDAMVAYLVQNHPDLQRRDVNELYEHLLLDVEMDASSSTSKIVEAINSIQLFYHRALIHLEMLPDDNRAPPPPGQALPPSIRSNLKAWWPWMKNYRIWEANRKVFLHPENYIRPELRTEKSPAFEELEQKLLQDEITTEAVEEGCQRYLESLNEISQLRIVGGYRYMRKDGKEGAFMVGLSRTEPPVYHYRLGVVVPLEQVPPNDRLDWEPWRKMGITIDSGCVQPVYAFNRLFVFWLETKPYNGTTFSSSGNYKPDSPEAKQVRLSLKFSFYNFNKEWVSPQTVSVYPEDPSDPETFPRVFTAGQANAVRLTAINPVHDADDDIYLKLRWHPLEWNVGKLTAGLDLEGGDHQWYSMVTSVPGSENWFLDRIGIGVGEVSAIVPWGSHLEQDEGDWFSFDAKGGTFLCRPNHPLENLIPGQIFGKPFQNVTAAFRVPSGDVFVFTQSAGPETLCYFLCVAGSWLAPVFVGDPAWPWGRPASVFQESPSTRISNVIAGTEGITYFLLNSNWCFSYSGGSYGATVEHFAGELQPPPSLGQLIGAGTKPPISWEASVAAGRSLALAFKLPGTVPGMDEALVVTEGQNPGRGAVIANLVELQRVSGGPDKSPFSGWTGLDAVFQVGESVVFSRGRDLVIYTWSSKEWTRGSLSELPGSASGLSTAFSGKDGKLYYFCGDQYAEVAPGDLTGKQEWLPVASRWGRPSLFSWLLRSVDGALIGADGTLSLFSAEVSNPPGQLPLSRCLRYTGFKADQLDSLVLDTRTKEPPYVSDVWTSDFSFPNGHGPAIECVTAAFVRSGVASLAGKRRDGLSFVARYTKAAPIQYQPDRGYPMYKPDPGYPIQLNEAARPSTDEYAQALLPDPKYKISRLTSHTAEQFGRRLFSGGIKDLLSLETQQLRELPKFTVMDPAHPRSAGRDELLINKELISEYPGQSNDPNKPPGLEFESPNGFYYWELFFHLPHLIGQALRQAQRFDEAKVWYEYVFDPTHFDPSHKDDRSYWRFMEFLTDHTRKNLQEQVNKYHQDPFDPHHIATLRPIAYRKAFVMSYLDNLLEWGDQLFRRYTRESLGEATMLYVLVADLLGKKPEELGKRKMEYPDQTYVFVRDLKATELTDEILQLENGVPQVPAPVPPVPPVPPDKFTSPNDSIFNPYFYIPENEQFVEYWNRVGDRLTKIRNGLDIDGVKRTLALFAPPVDVMALVKAFASGGGLAQALAEYNTPVPHYRFSFMLAKARELNGRLIGLGGALLSALEKKDAEELSLLRNTQERSILDLQMQIKQQQLTGAQESLAALQEGLKNAKARESHYTRLLAQGLSVFEQSQVAGMVVGQVLTQVSNVLGVAGSVSFLIPNLGSPFAITYGGQQLGAGISSLSNAIKSLAEAANFQSSLAATLGGWDRRAEEWGLQKTLAGGDTLQVGRQIKGAEIQVEIARQEIQVQKKQIKNNQSVDTFMRSKFTSQQLYQWMVGRLSAVYFQTYNLALQYAKAAQRAMQFELGLPETSVQYVGVGYWDSLKKGLLSGEQLQLDLDRLEKAHLEANQRRLEITRNVSLAQVDPLALVHLKEKGVCEFDLTEVLFDGDFPGHYCRQIKSVSLSFPAVVGAYESFNATLTQLSHRTLLSPDSKALSYLLTGSGSQDSVRVDWRPNQQVALSRGVNDSGLFQLNYQDERYLPFEGTGAVSGWRLEINGVDGAVHRNHLSDVILTVQYTALAGGDAFAEKVKSALPPAPRARMLNLAYEFPQAWQAFLLDPACGLTFTVDRQRVPGLSPQAQVSGVYLQYDLTEAGAGVVGRQKLDLSVKGRSTQVALSPGTLQDKSPVPLGDWKLTPPGAHANKFKPENIRNIVLVLTYSAKPSF